MSKKSWVALAALLIIALNAYVIWQRQSSSLQLDRGLEMRDEERQQERQRRRLSWESHPVIALDEPNLQDYLARIRNDDCVPISPRGFASPEVSSEIRKALDIALADFLAVYYTKNNTPQAVLSFMNSYGLVLNPVRVESLRKGLAARAAIPAVDSEAMSDEDVYVKYWDSHEVLSSMSGVVVEASCVTFWESKNKDVLALRDDNDLTRWVPKVWKGIHSKTPNFVPASGVTAETFADGPHAGRVLVADVKLIIDNENVPQVGKTPYLVRFIYRPSESIWQPVAMVAILLEEVAVGNAPF